MTDAHGPDIAREARCLLRGARAGTLATATAGQPFASLVTPATAPDGGVLLLLSGLSEHTRHLRADGRCSVMVAGAAPEANPQTAPRLTVTGLAAPEPDGAAKARWLAVHPYAAFYADLGDFALWRVTPAAGLFVAGFARAHRLRGADLLVDAAAVAKAADGIMDHCNADHPDAMARLAGAPGAWRMVAVDPDGCDLAQGEAVRRVSWPEPAGDAGAVRRAMMAML